MPIRRENRDRYPANWRAIGRAIRHRAGYRCECTGECGLHAGRRCAELDRQPAHWARGKVVLTIAHLDHVPEHCAHSNLKAMCQRCHLRMDREHHAETAARGRARQ
jgi:hypothetical protein